AWQKYRFAMGVFPPSQVQVGNLPRHAAGFVNAIKRCARPHAEDDVARRTPGRTPQSGDFRDLQGPSTRTEYPVKLPHGMESDPTPNGRPEWALRPLRIRKRRGRLLIKAPDPERLDSCGVSRQVNELRPIWRHLRRVHRGSCEILEINRKSQ